MKFREIKTDFELENYRHAIHQHIDVLLPLEYLKQGKVFGYYNDSNVICGGFALIMKGPFRVLSSIPNFEGLNLDPDLNKTAELTGVWLSKKERKNFSSLHFWLKIITKVITSRKKYFVYAYSTKKSGLEKIYSHGNPIVLYRGETIILPGMTAPDHESVEVLVRSRVYLQALKNPDFFLKKIFVKNKNKRITQMKQKEASYEMDHFSILPILVSASDFDGRRESQVNR